jgi:uncharacterized transporter YbjL
MRRDFIMTVGFIFIVLVGANLATAILNWLRSDGGRPSRVTVVLAVVSLLATVALFIQTQKDAAIVRGEAAAAMHSLAGGI